MISPTDPLAPPNQSFRVAVLIVLVLTIVRLVGLWLSTVDLFIDESQYWSWSRELAWGYFSKPPLLAWLIAAAEHLCGPSEACIRAPAPLMNLAISLLAYAIGRALYDARVGFWAAMLTAFGTGAVFSARIISTDLPLVLFWALALLAYVRLLHLPPRLRGEWPSQRVRPFAGPITGSSRPGGRRDRQALPEDEAPTLSSPKTGREKADWRWAMVLGFAIGAGLLAKYAMIYFLPGLLLAAVFEKHARALLTKSELWLASALAVITVSPNIVWNAANGFLTLRHAGGNVIGEPIEPSVIRPLEFLAAQFAVFGPAVFAVAIAAAIALLRERAIVYGAAVRQGYHLWRELVGRGWGWMNAVLLGRSPSIPHPDSPPQGRREQKVGSMSLLPADRILLGFALPPLIVVTMTASLVHAYANWAAAAFIPLAVLAAAILVRRNSTILLWGSLGLGLVTQIVLLGADAFAPYIRLPFLSTPNPYYRTLGWNVYGRTVGQLAHKLGISTIASDTRAEVASLLYYWRDQPEQILEWPTVDDLPNFDLTRGLTAAAPQPVLFVSQCAAAGRLEQFYAKVTPLGVFGSEDPVPRGFAAFMLEQPRGPIRPLAECPPE